ncbi:hypothetical protein GCG54_00002289, partial [Colletotrichum gloeosporioides]
MYIHETPKPVLCKLSSFEQSAVHTVEMAGSTSPQRASSTNAIVWYLIYNSLIISLSGLAVVFWIIGSKRPLLYPVEFGEWLRANPKTGTIIWTACGSVSAAIFLLLLKCCLLLMIRQRAREGATFSTIEGWNRCANEQPLFNTKRLKLSGFTIVNWLVALTLTTAFTTLLTPTNVLVSEGILGDELDYTADEFRDWYNIRGSDNNVPVNKRYLCERMTYTSSTGSVNFPTCPHTDDPIGYISAGVSATQQTLGVDNASVRVIDSLFQGSTGGVLPIGFRGIPAFNNVDFKNWDPSTRYPHFNYTLSQQGLSAEVSCYETLDTPIENKILETLNVTNSADNHNTLQLVEYSIRKDFCIRQDKWVVPSIGVVAHSLCQPDRDIKKYEFYLKPFGKYDNLPKITCTIEPMITNNLVTYSTATGLFTSKIVETIGSSAVPNETIANVNDLLSYSITSWGSGLIDSILSLNTTGDGSGNFTYPVAVESALRGLAEYAGTYSRIYYSAKYNATGRSTVNGTYTTSRVGYHQTQPTALLIVLPMILYLVSIAGWYTYKGLKTGVRIDDDFDPTNSTALVTAAALGASKKGLNLEKFTGLNQYYEMVSGFQSQ